MILRPNFWHHSVCCNCRASLVFVKGILTSDNYIQNIVQPATTPETRKLLIVTTTMSFATKHVRQFSLLVGSLELSHTKKKSNLFIYSPPLHCVNVRKRNGIMYRTPVLAFYETCRAHIWYIKRIYNALI